MKVSIKNKIKDATIISVVDGIVQEVPTLLNAGQSIKAKYVQELDEGLVNVHITDTDTLVNIQRRDVEYSSAESQAAIEEERNPSDPDPAPSPGPDGIKKIKRAKRRCCGGR